MKAQKSDVEKAKSFDPDSVIKDLHKELTILEGYIRSEEKDTYKQKHDLSKEIHRLGKSLKDFYKNNPDKSRKKKKESK